MRNCVTGSVNTPMGRPQRVSLARVGLFHYWSRSRRRTAASIFARGAAPIMVSRSWPSLNKSRVRMLWMPSRAVDWEAVESVLAGAYDRAVGRQAAQAAAVACSRPYW